MGGSFLLRRVYELSMLRRRVMDISWLLLMLRRGPILMKKILPGKELPVVDTK